MSYQVLYRRFRPQCFADIVGQDHIVKILKNQIITGSVSHAYLFAGPRGTGKTSAAKVFARAVNCENPKDGEACGKCDACTAASRNVLSDVIEIDAASNRGIDEIRQLKDRVNYLPSAGKYRVYIIDEVHMLTTEAFNALLKTLEEPPAHVIFIFATTEVQKILPTILSRCQRFDFVRLPEAVIKDEIKMILAKLGVKYEEEALDAISSAADGGMRDALSLTDKIINTAGEDGITLNDTLAALGVSDEDEIITLARYIVAGDAKGALTAFDEALKGGGDVENIVVSLGEYFRNLMVFSATGSEERLLNKAEKYTASLKELSAGLSAEAAVTYLSVMSRVKGESRFMNNMRFAAEAAIVKLCNVEIFSENAELKIRVERLEKRLDGLTKGGYAPVNYAAAQPSAEAVNAETQNQPSKPADKPSAAVKPAAASSPDGPSGKAAITEAKNLLTYAGNYIGNSENNLMLQGFFSEMQPEYYDGATLKVHFIGASVNMDDVFYKYDGLNKLNEVLAKRVGHDTHIIINEPPDTSIESYISSAIEAFGELEEIKE